MKLSQLIRGMVDKETQEYTDHAETVAQKVEGAIKVATGMDLDEVIKKGFEGEIPAFEQEVPAEFLSPKEIQAILANAQRKAVKYAANTDTPLTFERAFGIALSQNLQAVKALRAITNADDASDLL